MNDVAFKADGEVMEREHHLTPLIISRKRFAYAEKTVYRVYKAPADYLLVEAESAYEAIQKSGIESPLRVQREMVSRYHALESNLVQQREGDAPAVTDVLISESSQVAGLVYQGIFDELEDKTQTPFEAMSLADLNRKKPAKEIPVATSVEVKAEPPVAAVVEPVPQHAIEEESDVLTPEEVERLLQG